MSRHTPTLIVHDEVGTPRLAIETRCIECDIQITIRKIDVSMDALRGELAGSAGIQDGKAWLAHIGRKS